MKSILELSNVCYRYEGAKKNALFAVNARFAEGKVTALIGGAGTGKTTLLSLIAGFLAPSCGEVLFRGRDVRELDRNAYRASDLGCLFGAENLLENESALFNVETALRLSRKQGEGNLRERAESALRRAGLSEENFRIKVARLSPEQSRRAAVARALANRPLLVVADEPIEGLEGDAAREILKLLADYARMQNACVLVLSRKPSAAAYADEIWGLNGGRVLFIR